MLEELGKIDQAIKRAENLVKKNFTPELEQELVNYINNLQELASQATPEQED